MALYGTAAGWARSCADLLRLPSNGFPSRLEAGFRFPNGQWASWSSDVGRGIRMLKLLPIRRR